MRPLLVAALTLMAVGGCSTEAKSPGGTTTAANDRQCFFASNVNNCEAVGETVVNVKVGVRDVYQLTLFSPCSNIDWAQRIALIPRTGSSLCTGQANAEIVAPSPFGAQRCEVQSVRHLTPEEAAALPKGEKP